MHPIRGTLAKTVSGTSAHIKAVVNRVLRMIDMLQPTRGHHGEFDARVNYWLREKRQFRLNSRYIARHYNLENQTLSPIPQDLTCLVIVNWRAKISQDGSDGGRVLTKSGLPGWLSTGGNLLSTNSTFDPMKCSTVKL
jgi:hypothetical protein